MNDGLAGHHVVGIAKGPYNKKYCTTPKSEQNPFISFTTDIDRTVTNN